MEGARLWVQQMSKIQVADFASSFEDGSIFLSIVVAAWPGSQVTFATQRTHSRIH
jgi:hypothetical protein